jgi:hypothetical protein
LLFFLLQAAGNVLVQQKINYFPRLLVSLCGSTLCEESDHDAKSAE